MDIWNGGRINMGIQSLVASDVDVSLSTYFSWAGSNFPFYSNAADIIISTATTWNDAVGYKKVGKLTINAGQTLTIQKSPFYIFADEIAFGDTDSIIDASGPSGTGGVAVFPSVANMANGGTASYSTTAKAQGGCGGGMLFVLCNRITGANGIIKANGGDGGSNGALSVGSSIGAGGQGAFSRSLGTPGGNSGSESFHFFVNGVSNYSTGLTLDTVGTYPSVSNLLGAGGVASGVSVPIGGGTGGTTEGGYGCGGSGIGGGGGAGITNTTGAGGVALITPSVTDLLMLANLKCLGGGGGGACLDETYVNACGGGGGGGGAVVIWTHTATATPTLQANGGAHTGTHNKDGGAGVTYLITL
jgi:hypothetical protein